ncbi:MAG: hypothetical protein ACI8Z5_002244 [Lentimonas sp.]|jgi:hypothetical protein
MTAPNITSQGINWPHNFPEVSGNNITTGPGPARRGNYGFFALPHGNYSSGPCIVSLDDGPMIGFGGDPLDPADTNLYLSVNKSTDSQGDPVLEVTYRKRTNDPALSYT